MSRSLPLRASLDTLNAEAALTGTVQVFDPAMCCPTGACGPGVDPALLQIARDLRWLQARGVEILRVGLAQDPDAFVRDSRIAGLLQAFGDKALPAIVVGDQILVHGRYPSRDELVTALSADPATVTADLVTGAREDSCCTPGSGCC
ncbi:MAG: arsenite efflux transporter metallochaperone ArsD [Gemmatimonadaceae bacterium]